MQDIQRKVVQSLLNKSTSPPPSLLNLSARSFVARDMGRYFVRATYGEKSKHYDAPLAFRKSVLTSKTPIQQHMCPNRNGHQNQHQNTLC